MPLPAPTKQLPPAEEYYLAKASSIEEASIDIESVNLALLYHENSRRYAMDVQPSVTGPKAPRVPPGKEIVRSHLFVPPTSDRAIALPAADFTRPSASLGTLISTRRSRRSLADEPITLAELSTLLAHGYGVTKVVQTPNGAMCLRAVPSGGARFPLEIYFVARKVNGLTSGVYHYRPETHLVERLSSGDFTEDIERATYNQGSAVHAAVTIVIAAVWHRSMEKYGDRGYRGILMETGAVMAHLYLATEALGLGGVAMEGVDELLEQVVGIRGPEEAVLLSFSVGRRPAGADEQAAGGVF